MAMTPADLPLPRRPEKFNVVIHSYDNAPVKVEISTRLHGNEAIFAAALLFSCFLFRQLGNMIGTKFDKELLKLDQNVVSAPEKASRYLAAWDGKPSNKQFRCELTVGQQIQFKMAPKGFGLFVRGIEDYAREGAYGLFWALVFYLDGLRDHLAARVLWETFVTMLIYLDGERMGLPAVSLTNQLQLAVEVAGFAWRKGSRSKEVSLRMTSDEFGDELGRLWRDQPLLLRDPTDTELKSLIAQAQRETGNVRTGPKEILNMLRDRRLQVFRELIDNVELPPLAPGPPVSLEEFVDILIEVGRQRPFVVRDPTEQELLQLGESYLTADKMRHILRTSRGSTLADMLSHLKRT